MRILKFIPLAVLVAGMVAIAVVGSADAAPGGNGKGKGQGGGGGGAKASETTATLTVSPNPVSSGQYYLVSGSGFTASERVFLAFHEPFCCASKIVWADASGGIAMWRPAGSAGTYTVNAYQYHGKKLVLVATVSFSVTS